MYPGGGVSVAGSGLTASRAGTVGGKEVFSGTDELSSLQSNTVVGNNAEESSVVAGCLGTRIAGNAANSVKV